MKITVLGAGSWGTALSMTLWKNGHSVYLWTHDEKEAKYLEKRGKYWFMRCLPSSQDPWGKERFPSSGRSKSS